LVTIITSSLHHISAKVSALETYTLLIAHIVTMAPQKRKRAAGEQQSAKAQTAITSFAKVSKVRGDEGSAKKRKTLEVCVVAPLAVSPSIKRKREHPCISEDKTTASEIERAQTPPATPRGKRLRQEHSTLLSTPSRGALALFDKLNLNCRLVENQDSLPEELEQLKDLYTAFLAALSIHYAHDGSTLPVEVRQLLPTTTSHWKKRNVTLIDLQRILALEARAGSVFVLEDFGRAGIQVVRIQQRAATTKRMTSYIDEVELSAIFEETLKKEWRQFESSTGKENRDGKAFLAQISLAPIKINESAKNAAPLFSRGQQRLADLRAGPASTPLAAAQATAAAHLANDTSSTTVGTQDRSTALLDRILAKQTLLASLPSGPSKAILERRAALHRVEDVSRVLTLLASANKGGRYSLSLSATTSQLQQSLRNPINAAEVEQCLGLIANDIAPGFVRIVRTAEVKGVVVARNAAVGVAELRARVQKALAEDEKV
jgi:hypothetical protein